MTGVNNIFEPRSYQTRSTGWRTVEGVIGTAGTAADYKVFWGAAGAVDSVVDVTHNVLVNFSPNVKGGYTWGFLTQAATSAGSGQASGDGAGRTGVLSSTDFGCVAPLDSYPAPKSHLVCPAGSEYNLVATASLGSVAFGNSPANDIAAAAVPNGFGMYLPGHFFLFEMSSAALPTAGTVWTMRSYTGSVNGGGLTSGTGGNLGAYSFTPVPSPFTAVGASLKAQYSVTNVVRGVVRNDLDAIHTVPDPYYVTNAFESSPSGKNIKFVNLPTQAIIRIYSTSGVLVRVIEHNSSQFGGMENWDVRNRNNQVVASGVYFYHIESMSGARRVGRMTIVNFAQ